MRVTARRRVPRSEVPRTVPSAQGMLRAIERSPHIGQSLRLPCTPNLQTSAPARNNVLRFHGYGTRDETGPPRIGGPDARRSTRGRDSRYAGDYRMSALSVVMSVMG
jgi:hypothetical protein